jgi:hypothetical protein
VTFLDRDRTLGVIINDPPRRPRAPHVRFERVIEHHFGGSKNVERDLYPQSSAVADWISRNISMAPMPGLRKMTVGVTRDSDVELNVTMNVVERDGDQPTDVVFHYRFSGHIFHGMGQASAMAMVERGTYDLLRRAVLHELDECWHVAGERVRDPHEHDLKVNVLPPAAGEPIK